VSTIPAVCGRPILLHFPRGCTARSRERQNHLENELLRVLRLPRYLGEAAVECLGVCTALESKVTDIWRVTETSRDKDLKVGGSLATRASRCYQRLSRGYLMQTFAADSA
jgi:hypothetical protein